MRIALISNAPWLDEELPEFQQLVAGLAAEGVEIVHVMPGAAAGGGTGAGGLPEDVPAASQRLTWNDSRWSALRSLRLAHLHPQLQDLNIDLLHAHEGRLWRGALRLGRKLNVPVLLGIASRLDLPLIYRLRNRIRRDQPTFIAATQPLADAAFQALASGGFVGAGTSGGGGTGTSGGAGQKIDQKIELIHPGVAACDEQTLPAKPAEGIFCAAICGNGLFDNDCQTLFEALPPIIADYPQAQFFLDGQGREHHALWLAARRYGLLSNLSMVPRKLGRRELLLRADVMIQPQPLGRPRTLPLQAMARRPAHPGLHRPLGRLPDRRPNRLADRAPRPPKLGEADPRRHRRPRPDPPTGLRARQWVRANCGIADQITRTLTLYRQVAGQAIRFPGTGGNQEMTN